ncbi:MAG: S-layer family protein [Coleofasciculus sp. B1-GNL1-01]|uniref:two-partner secretion domain-containing protein n=1 Tax=Coleofasciculus sp. B1-GNL1-01 TaxID=3068484 RepID=UPI0032F80D69
MRKITGYTSILSSLSVTILTSLSPVSAQIVPDNTLPVNSQVTGCPVCLIEGGTVQGVNLFHSFEEFSVQTGGEAFFNNGLDIENILGRVTGTNISDIDGLIRANGTANLFLINPNGIVFGKNARLNIGGSFVASTANAIGFGNQGIFSATEPDAPPLLTVSPDAFFFNQTTSGDIENHSISPAGVNLLAEPLKGLRVADGHSLLLLGGDIAINGGGLNALGGRVELIGLAAPGRVALNVDGNHLSLNVPDDLARADISLTNEAIVNTSGEGGGEIQVWGRRIMLKEGSQILATTLGSEAGKGITVDASESIELIGTGFESFEQTFIAGSLSGQLRPFNPGTGLFTGAVGEGLGGTIEINTKQLKLRDGAIIFSPTFGQGSGENLSVRAWESVELIGSGLVTSTVKDATGAAGNITINTRQLIVRDGAVVAAVTFGKGAGGEIAINASESVEVLESPTEALVPTGIFANTIGGTGAAGGMTIDTERLIVQGGAQIATQSGLLFLGYTKGGEGGNLIIRASELVEVSGISTDNRFNSGIYSGTDTSSRGGHLTIIAPLLLLKNNAIVTARTLGTGQGGNLMISTQALRINQGQITTDTLDSGQGGNLRVTVSEVIQLMDTQTDVQVFEILTVEEKSGDVIVATVSSDQFFDGLSASSLGSGNAGNVIVATPLLIIEDGSGISVNSSGLGAAGTVEIEAGSVQLQNGLITSRTTSGNGGNLTLYIEDILLLRDGSQISSTAGTAQAGGDGGNITINAGVIAAIPNENSDITANAFSGQGGNITITTQGLYNFAIRSREEIQALLKTDDLSQFDPSQLLSNDISAISQTSTQLSRIPTLNLQGIDPVGGLVELPTDFVDVTRLVSQNLCFATQDSEFIITGRGGLPLSPDEVLPPDTVVEDLGTLVSHPGTSAHPDAETMENLSVSNTQPPKQIIEAQGWIKTPDGQIILVAEVPPTNYQGNLQNPVHCVATDE